MNIGKTLYVTSRQEWRQWLQKYHQTEPEIWLINFKKSSGKPSLPYNEAVEEALCFGWIDSIQKRLDDERSTQRYSPRKPGSNLSATNYERLTRLIKAGLVTPFGLERIENQLKEYKEKLKQ